MALLADLAAGRLGLVVVPPSHLTVTEETKTSATFADPEHGLGWWFYFFPGIHLDLDLEHVATLRRDVERHTRLLFDAMFAAGPSGLDLPNSDRPRTDDANWTPLVEIERTELVKGTMLTVLHRMHYQRGRESVMGHTLVPVADGLFEARWLCMARVTGFRESALMLQLGGDGEPGFQPQSVYDDPKHDETFPQHSLSLARAAKRWHTNGALTIARHPRPGPSSRKVALEPIGCEIVPPPRFVPEGMSTDGGDISCVLDRVSFSGTDGVDRLIVTRTDERIRAIAVARRLATFARDRSRRIYERSGLANVTCEAMPLDTDPRVVMVVTEGDPDQVGGGRARAVWRWFVDDNGRVWSIAIATTIAVPVDELSHDVAAVATSWRRTGEG